MYHKSPFPDLPNVPETNVHHLLLNRPDQQEWPDYTLLVDVATGQRRSFRNFVERVRDGATALGADVTQGGLGLRPENGEIVGILSENCLVCYISIHWSTSKCRNEVISSGLCRIDPFFASHHSSLCDVLILRHAIRI